MAVKNSLNGVSWSEWESDLKGRNPDVLEQKKEELAEEIQFVRFQQYGVSEAVDKAESLCK